MLNGTAAKFLVAAAGAISTGLTTFYSTAKWEPVAIAGIAALLVYLVPNKAATPKGSTTNSGGTL